MVIVLKIMEEQKRRFLRGSCRENLLDQCLVVYLGQSVPGGYKYGDLTLQVGGVSYETVKYGHESLPDSDPRMTSLAKSLPEDW
jgi:hypothetical protein